MKVLLVGAGAVGQVFGRHLKLGGAEVSFFVKKKYAEECKRGFRLYPLNRRNPRLASFEFKDFNVLTEVEEVRAQKWDQVYLCVSSTALRSGWFEEFARAIADATLVTLQPGVDDREYILSFVPEDRVVFGMISLISYYAPLPGEKVPEPGMAYWFPPLSPSPFSGPEARARAVVESLNRGKLPAAVRSNVPESVAFPSAVLMSLLTALELSDWSLSKLVHNGTLPQACLATSEAVSIISRKLKAKPPFAMKLIKPFVMKAVLGVAPHFVPLDLETYLKIHFTKVGDQTRFYMKGYIDQGKQYKMPVHSLESLERKVKKASLY